MKIYVGNLPYETTNDDLRSAFEAHGSVESAEVVIDRFTNRSRGFGFVFMPDDAQGKVAVDAMNGAQLGGRTLKVDEARNNRREAG